MTYWPSYQEPEPLNADELRLVHARSNLDHVSLDEQGNAVLHNVPHARKPFENTVHFTLNALVASHTYGNFDASHCVIVSPLREAVEAGNVPEGLLAADTYFHADANRNVTLPRPVIFAPDGMEVPKELELLVHRYPRGLTDEETHRFKDRAVGEYFASENLPFYNVGYDDWAGNPDMQRGRKIQQEFNLPENTYWGRHMHSPSSDFAGMMGHLHENLGKLRAGERYIRDRWGRDVGIGEVIEENATHLNEFLQRREEAGDPPNAMAFYRKHAGEYDLARRSILAAGLNTPRPAEA